MYQASEKGIAFLKKEEGFRSTPYGDNRDSGYCSWGYGTKVFCPSGCRQCDKTITKNDADAEMRNHLSNEVVAKINQYIGLEYPPLNQNQMDALCSLVYNVGFYAVFEKQYSNGYDKGSTIYNKILNGDLDGAGKAFNTTGWDNHNRRSRERDLWFNADYTQVTPGQNPAAKVAENLANTLKVKTEYVYAGAGVLLLIVLVALISKKRTGNYFPFMNMY